MKKDKRVFKCDKCPSRRFKNAMQLAKHFKSNPTHRNHRQQVQFEYTQKYKNKGARSTVYDHLPTVSRSTRTSASRVTVKFCTQCGMGRKPAHAYCGGCGSKL